MVSFSNAPPVKDRVACQIQLPELKPAFSKQRSIPNESSLVAKLRCKSIRQRSSLHAQTPKQRDVTVASATLAEPPTSDTEVQRFALFDRFATMW